MIHKYLYIIIIIASEVRLQCHPCVGLDIVYIFHAYSTLVLRGSTTVNDIKAQHTNATSSMKLCNTKLYTCITDDHNVDNFFCFTACI